MRQTSKTIGLALAIAATTTAGAAGLRRRATASPPTEVTFGMHTDLSGVAATYGVSSSNGVKMRFDEANAAGGINGRKLKLIVEDQGYQVPKAVQACNKLINRDKVFAFVAPLGTPMNNACFKDQFAAGMPNLFPLTAARSMYEPFERAEVLRRRLLRRPDPLGHQVLREEQGQEGGLRDVPGHRLRQGDPRRRQAADQEARHQARRDRGAQADRPGLHRLDHQAARGAGCDLIAMGTIVRDTIIPYTTARKSGWTDVTFLGSAATYDLVVGAAPGMDGFYGMGLTEMPYADSEHPDRSRPSSTTTRTSSTSIPTSARSTATSPPTSPSRA